MSASAFVRAHFPLGSLHCNVVIQPPPALRIDVTLQNERNGAHEYSLEAYTVVVEQGLALSLYTDATMVIPDRRFDSPSCSP